MKNSDLSKLEQSKRFSGPAVKLLARRRKRYKFDKDRKVVEVSKAINSTTKLNTQGDEKFLNKAFDSLA